MPINYIITSRKESKAGFFSVAQLWVIDPGGATSFFAWDIGDSRIERLSVQRFVIWVDVDLEWFFLIPPPQTKRTHTHTHHIGCYFCFMVSW